MIYIYRYTGCPKKIGTPEYLGKYKFYRKVYQTVYNKSLHWNSFLYKNENKRNNLQWHLDLNECYPRHNPERHSKGFSRRISCVMPAVLSSIITQKVFNEKNIFLFSVLKNSRHQLLNFQNQK